MLVDGASGGLPVRLLDSVCAAVVVVAALEVWTPLTLNRRVGVCVQAAFPPVGRVVWVSAVLVGGASGGASV